MSATNWRKVENDTGLDLQVPNDAQLRGGDTFTYVVVAVTTLPHYKNHSKHKPSDVVQFAVQRTHKQIAGLCETLVALDPSLSLPALPRRSTRETLTQRTESMSRIVMYIAKEQQLCVQDPVIRFLGFNPAKVKRAFSKAASLFEEEEEASLSEGEDLFGAVDAMLDDPELARDLDELASQEGGKLLGDMDSAYEGVSDEKSARSRRNNTGDLFSGSTEEADDSMLSAETKELLTIDGDLEALLGVPSVKSVTSTKKKKAAPLFDDDLFGPSDAGGAMDASNIADYLAAAATENAEDVELF